MKVLVNNYTDDVTKLESPKTIICDECQSELLCDKSDIQIGTYGLAYIECPLCKNQIVNEFTEKYDIELTKDNIEFPIHFYHTSEDTGAVNVCNTENIRNGLNRAIDYFRNNKDEFAYETAHGDLTMHVYRYEGDEEYHVVVSKDYYDVHIPFQPEDY